MQVRAAHIVKELRHELRQVAINVPGMFAGFADMVHSGFDAALPSKSL